jgi:hypothetical protein
MDESGNYRPLPALFPRPIYPIRCATIDQPGVVPVNAVLGGVPTTPTTTPSLDKEEKRRCSVVYFVRYNKIERSYAINIINTGLIKPVL